MIINSDFKDYYDFVAHQYRDIRAVYDRKEQSIRGNEFKAYRDLASLADKHTIEIDHMRHPYAHVGTMIVGGKLYPFYNSYDTTRARFSSPYRELDRLGKGNRAKVKRRYWPYYNNHLRIGTGVRSQHVTEICQKYKAPVIALMPCHIILNPCMRLIGTPVDAYTACQDIMCCLASVEPVIPVQDDITKAQAAGFCRKTSFRHRK
jgi:hypothetical protein|tara:strand:- start:24474 stop:25088 length:615 start_codon:yes stop_codon:yes gene_type:complete